jgi:MFS family permease
MVIWYLLAVGLPAGAGLVITAIALGSMVGAGLYAGFGTTWPRRRVFAGSIAVIALGVVGMGLLPPVPPLLAAAGLAGLGSGPLPALVFVLTTERIPDAVRGRVLGLQTAGMMVAGPAGLLVTGFLIEGAGVAAAGGSVIVAWIAVTVLALVAPALRNLEVVRADHR